ncbi:MAG: metallophosphoesterase [Deltaproteobacteria bacterium]|nr:metallophosphoesterase [Deltaproteobacteria bacterium]
MLYAIGDIHGERELLEELLASLPFRDGDRLVFVGDYVDRGPDSKGVVETLLRVLPRVAPQGVLRRRRLPHERRRPHARELWLLRRRGTRREDVSAPAGSRALLQTSEALSPRRRLSVRPRGHRPRPARRGGCRLRVTQHPLRGSPLGAHQRRPAAQARCHHRLRPHARGRLLGSLERTLQHRHRHRCSLRRPPHRNPPPRRNPLPGLTNAWSRTAFRAPTLRAARLRESPSGSPTGVR